MKKWNIFRYLGYDRNTIQSCRQELDKDNLTVVKNVSLMLMILLMGITIFYLLFDNELRRNIICISSILLLVVVFIACKKLLRQKEKITPQKTDLLVDFFSFLCFSVGIYLGTFSAHGEMAVAPIWMFFFAILIFNRLPLQNLIVLVAACAVFSVCSFISKRPFIFQYDMMHALTSIFASVFMSWSKTRLKVENILAIEKLKSANLAILETVEEQEKEAALLRHKASRDDLTGFYKKDAFEFAVRDILARSSARERHAMICLDVDNFKAINDNLGHLFGDEVLKDLVLNMKYSLDKSDLIGRFGGDEFVVFIKEISSREQTARKVQTLMDSGKRSYRSDEKELCISFSAGISFCPDDGRDYKELFEKADIALYEAKRGGKGIYRFYKNEEKPAHV